MLGKVQGRRNPMAEWAIAQGGTFQGAAKLGKIKNQQKLMFQEKKIATLQNFAQGDRIARDGPGAPAPDTALYFCDSYRIVV